MIKVLSQTLKTLAVPKGVRIDNGLKFQIFTVLKVMGEGGVKTGKILTIFLSTDLMSAFGINRYSTFCNYTKAIP